MSCLPQTPERRTGEGSKVRSEASRAHGWARPIRATPGGDHSCTRQVRTAPRVFCHHGLFGRWTVRNLRGAALSSARTALTRMFFDARTPPQVSEDVTREVCARSPERLAALLTEATELGVAPREVTWRK